MPTRIYNEIYTIVEHREAVEAALKQLAVDHPEWQLDFSAGEGNWEEADA